MKRLQQIILSLFSAVALPLAAQEHITLAECRQLAVENYPLIKQYKLVEESQQFTLENIAKNYLPQIGLNGQATYQSDVTKLNLDLSALGLDLKLPTMSKDQYKVTVDVSQLIWDGGATSSQRKLALANSEVNKQQVGVNLYAVKERINQLYFGILAVDEQLQILDLTATNLDANKKVVASMLKNGVAMQADVDQIEVELLSIDQNRIEQKAVRKSYLQMLSLFIHRTLGDDAVLEKPEYKGLLDAQITRPELDLYRSQINALITQTSAIKAKNMPRLSLFAQGGYGRPGLNMLDDSFRLFAVGGVKLSWNFGTLYTKKNEERLISNNVANLEIQREAFLFNTNLELTKEQAEVQKIKDLLAKDDEIIRLRTNVKRAAESRYKNGTYQMNELIRDINNESLARQTQALHEIQYLMNLYDYKQTKGTTD